MCTLHSGAGRLLDTAASLALPVRTVRLAAPGLPPRLPGIWRARLLEGALTQQRGPPLRGITPPPGSPRGILRMAADQAVQGEQRPGLDHVNPTDGNQDARRSARLLGVQGEVTEKVVFTAGPRGMWADVGGTDSVRRLQEGNKSFDQSAKGS